MRHTLKALALLPLLVWLTGCASVSTIPVQTMEPIGVFPYSAIVLDVAENTAEDAFQQTIDLEIRIVEELNRVAAIPEVRLAHPEIPTSDALVIKVSVDAMRKVSGTARFFLGAFAGKASMTTEVIFVDGDLDETLGIYQITGKSGGSGMSGGTDDAVTQAADGIVEIVCETFGFAPPAERPAIDEEDPLR